MKNRWAPAFTVVELLIIIVVIAILATLGVFAYNSIQRATAERATQSDLTRATAEMQRAYQDNGGAYPSALPSLASGSQDITLTLKRSGTLNYYSNVTAVQNGMLLAQICQDLIDQGVGKGVNQGGVTRDYITGCGNWNHNSMQVTGWDTRTYATPVSSAALLTYANTFTTSDTFNKAQEAVVKNFYYQLVERLTHQGGSFPVTSFWDYWATPQNGGVTQQPLINPQARPHYCIEATHAKYSDIKWHITEALKLKSYGC